MKPIDKDELYQHISNFLKAKGVHLGEGSYTQRIQKGCNLFAEAVNMSAQGVEKAKTEIDKKLDQMRQVIHEKTAPQPRPSAPAPETPPAASTPPKSEASAAASKRAAKKPSRRAAPSSRKKRA